MHNCTDVKLKDHKNLHTENVEQTKKELKVHKNLNKDNLYDCVLCQKSFINASDFLKDKLLHQ